MNELQEQILALLVAKFQGVRKDGLQHLAAAIGLQVATIEEANGVVDKLTADKVSQYVTGCRRGNKQSEPNLRKRTERKVRFRGKGKANTADTPHATSRRSDNA